MAQTGSNAAKAVIMPMRLKMPNDFPNIGKFSDAIEWNQLGAPKMYFKEEDLKEEEIGEVVKDAEYYKKRRNQRRSYRKKNLLLFEDDSYPLAGGLKFNGQLANTTLAELEATQLNKHSAGENDEAPFKYALLQFTKKDNGENEINVIPVGDMFLFKKAPKAQDELLVDIEARFENERLRVKDRHEKYKGIYNSLANAEKNRLKAEGADGEEFTGGFESTSLFMKAGFGKKKKSNGSLGGGTQSYINENGIDVDELKEHDWCQGDYTSRYADDEEDNVVVEQISNNQYEDQEMSASLRYDEEAPDSDEDQEEDGKKEEDLDEEVGMVDESMVSSAAEARKMLNLSNMHKQVQLDKQAKLEAINAAAAAALAAESGPKEGSSSNSGSTGNNSSSSGKASLKRSRVSFEDPSAVAASIAANTSTDVSGAGHGGASAAGTVSTAAAAGDAKKSRASLSGSSENTSSTSTAGNTEYTFNEEGVRKFIQHKGGKVTTGVLLEFFKPMMKSYRDDQGRKAGKERFLGIVKDATATMEDPVLGTVLTVKQ